eukprot:7566160-Ditylum_brightwellii.AAC.1
MHCPTALQASIAVHTRAKNTSTSHYANIARTILWYLLFGFLHEAAHVVCALLLAMTRDNKCSFYATMEILCNASGGKLKMIARALFERRVDIPSVFLSNTKHGDIVHILSPLDIVQHSGWIFSALLAYVVVATQPAATVLMDKRNEKNLAISPIVLAAVVTAIEAVSTDLFHLTQCRVILSFFHYPNSATSSAAVTFFCGNFGVILLNQAWMQMPSYFSDGTKSSSSKPAVLDVLEKMANVTMMRGAQSGGIVTYLPSSSAKKRHQLIAIRSRVVNRKRTDLSKLLRNKVQRDVFSSSPLLGVLPICNGSEEDDLTHAFMGHTRFATSSKSTFEGTHPQRWTPPRNRRMYDFNLIPSDKTSYLNSFIDTSLRLGTKEERSGNNLDAATAAATTTGTLGRDGKITFSTTVAVENYITHNGDFDFYVLNDASYDLGTIQKWLEIALRSPLPATVDSAAIAGK